MTITAPPSQISRYEILGELGRGDMGVVYKARDPLIERLVALKTIAVELRGAEAVAFRQRFFREARSAGGLNHPNIVTIHDVGESEDVAYIAMEFLGGRSLREILDSGTVLPIATIIDIAAQVAEGLAFAHRVAIVHRDIKPANIMVLENGVVKITDFGIASLPSGTRTIAGTVFGSPWYISPERLRGERADGRSDIFSLGAVLHEMLTGLPPFTGADLDSLFAQILNVMPAAPSARNRNIPPAVDAIVAKAMAKSVEDRFRDADAMAAALRALAAPGALTPPPPAPPEPANPDVLPWREGFPATVRITAAPAAAAAATDPALVPMLEAPAAALPPVAAAPAIPLKGRRAAWIAVAAVLLAVVAGNALWPRTSRDVSPPRGDVASPKASTAGPVVTAPGVTALSGPPSAGKAAPPVGAAPVASVPPAPAAPAALSAAPTSPVAPPPAPSIAVAPTAAAAPAKTEVVKPETPKADAAKVEAPKAGAPKAEAVAAPAASASATLGIAVTPWGEVYVNGKKVGVSPPLTELKLAPGSYAIEIRNTTFPPYRATVDLRTQASARIRHKFQ